APRGSRGARRSARAYGDSIRLRVPVPDARQHLAGERPQRHGDRPHYCPLPFLRQLRAMALPRPGRTHADAAPAPESLSDPARPRPGAPRPRAALPDAARSLPPHAAQARGISVPQRPRARRRDGAPHLGGPSLHVTAAARTQLLHPLPHRAAAGLPHPRVSRENTSDEAMGRGDSRRRRDPPYRSRLSVPEARSVGRPASGPQTGDGAEGLPHPGRAAFSRALLIMDERAGRLTYRRRTCAQRPPEPSVLCRTVSKATLFVTERRRRRIDAPSRRSGTDTPFVGLIGAG